MSRGHDRERAVKALLEGDDWLVVRAAGSLGIFDLVAMKRGDPTRVIEVKSTAGGPYERFGPVARREMRAAARQAGADAWLAYWPPRKPLRWIHEDEWPPPLITDTQEVAAA